MYNSTTNAPPLLFCFLAPLYISTYIIMLWKWTPILCTISDLDERKQKEI